ncbi:MAG: SLBB domain-containing protein [Chitinispirillales bacterium]|jgi:protein involved in polysaccharide export with SLBB domain|nr:SLBB domain-containing protein [Chitinispirillales bacterium]
MNSRSLSAAVKVILALAVFSNVFGQQMPHSAAGMPFATTGTGMPSSGFMMQQPAFSDHPGIVPTDNTIDPDEYLIGSGDVFFIAAAASPAVRFVAPVDHLGRIFVQNIGSIDLGKITYTDAKRIIAEHVSTILRQPSEIYVTLTQAKNATISFTGDIHSPGAYDLPGTTRLLDAIRVANNGTLPTPANADLRQIWVTNGDQTVSYDLLAYLYKADFSQNPYIYPGDRVRISPAINSVRISGAIKYPHQGSYSIKVGETLGEFLSMFVFDDIADTDNIIIFQPSDNSKIRLSAALEPDRVLNNLDVITIPVKKNLPGVFTVSISGEVASPGQYPMQENITTAKHLIDMAGGIKENANMALAAIIRPISNLPDRFTSGAPQMNIIRPERGASISLATASLDYTIIRLALYNADKIMLEPGDQIVIPKRDNFVYISGAVRNPGAYPFVAGRSSGYYVSRAGGYTNNADRSNVQVFVRYGDLVQSIEPRCVEAGSVIVVPSSVQHKLLTQVVLPIITTIATIATAMVAVYSIR